ncbi:hypothetical protein AHAS_Ahas16G0149900 [Arachis hypogaea]
MQYSQMFLPSMLLTVETSTICLLLCSRELTTTTKHVSSNVQWSRAKRKSPTFGFCSSFWNAWKERPLWQSSHMKIPRCEMLYVMYFLKPITGYVLGIYFLMQPPIYVTHDSSSYLDTACLQTWRLTSSRCNGRRCWMSVGFVKSNGFVESRYGVLEFVTNFQRCIDFLRDNEDELEFRSWYGTPVLQTEFVELEKDRWTKYTREMFWRFCEALKRPKKKWEVSRQNVGNKFSCTCLRIESFELPCVHILVVLVRLDYTIIPTTLVLHRWSKTAKLHYGLNCTGNETHEQTTTYRSRLEAFAQLCT